MGDASSLRHDVSVCKELKAWAKETGDVAREPFDRSGEEGETGEVGSLSFKLPLILSILEMKDRRNIYFQNYELLILSNCLTKHVCD